MKIFTPNKSEMFSQFFLASFQPVYSWIKDAVFIRTKPSACVCNLNRVWLNQSRYGFSSEFKERMKRKMKHTWKENFD